MDGWNDLIRLGRFDLIQPEFKRCKHLLLLLNHIDRFVIIVKGPYGIILIKSSKIFEVTHEGWKAAPGKIMTTMTK